MTENTKTAGRDRVRARHARAVIQAEIRRLSRDQAGAERWREGSFEEAVAAAVRAGAIEKLPGDVHRESR